jgi:predicted dehydrogenase
VKQVVRSSRKGEIRVQETAVPRPGDGELVIRNSFSLLSAGTERSALEFDEKSLLGKARSRPDLVRKVVERARREGPIAAAQAAFSKLDEARPLGYSCAGIVESVGRDIPAGLFQPGMRVACSGAGYANHAEFIVAPASMCTPVPDGVGLDSACYVTVAAIALHGVRQAQPALGERAAVIGCGLIGQIAVQLLAANGVSVLAIDTNAARVDLARASGARMGARPGHDDVNAAALSMSDGFGLDFVIVCAASDTSEPIELAAMISRDRARVISVGATGLTLPRRPFYEKELSFNISRSYGPGRYDPVYEEASIDYPIGYVRWTEGRNFQAVVELMESGALNVGKLTTHRFPIDQATEAYDLIRGAREPFLGVVLEYMEDRQSCLSGQAEARQAGLPVLQTSDPNSVSFIGAGSFARTVLLPAFKSAGAGFRAISSAAGLSASDLAARFGFARTATQDEVMTSDAASIVIVTRHDSHARLAAEALRNGKNVFVEKPLALDEAELVDVLEAASSTKAILAVGFNRRFAPATIAVREHFAGRGEPLLMNVRINAGPVPLTHWIQNDEIGGGRIIGEACHFIDWMTFVCGALPVEVHAICVDARRADFPNRDQSIITIRFANGSAGTLTFSGRGDTRLPKERCEVFAAERSAVLDDFRKVTVYSRGRERVAWKGAQDKGHRQEVREFLRAVADGRRPIGYDELAAVTRATFAAEESLRSGMGVAIG